MDDCRKCQTVTATSAGPGDFPGGLGSTRVVRFRDPAEEAGDDEPGNVATGPQDAEVSGCIGSLGAGRFVDARGRRASWDVGTTVPAVSGPLRGGRGRRAC